MLYPAELLGPIQGGPYDTHAVALYNNLCGKKNQVLFSNNHPGCNHCCNHPAQPLKHHRTLHPHLPLKAPSYPGFAQQVLLVDGYMEYHVVAVQLQVIYLFFGNPVGACTDFRDFPYDGVLVTFYAARHETGFYDGVDILMGNPSGYHGIEVYILYGQCLYGVLVAVFGGFQETAALFGCLPGVLGLFFRLIDRQQHLSLDCQPVRAAPFGWTGWRALLRILYSMEFSM